MAWGLDSTRTGAAWAFGVATAGIAVVTAILVMRRNPAPAAPVVPIESSAAERSAVDRPAARAVETRLSADPIPRSTTTGRREDTTPARGEAAASHEGLNARRLFYGDAKPGSEEPTTTNAALASGTGLKYAVIRRLATGEEAEVDPDTSFQGGDRVRFSFESNIDGYLYVVQEGSSGRWTVLFPNPQINGGRNAIRRFQRYLVPSQSWFLFDANPGAEQVIVMLSKEPLEQLQDVNEPVTKSETVDRSVVNELGRALKSRDLVLEKDRSTEHENPTYVINRDELGRAVIATFRLVHGQ